MKVIKEGNLDFLKKIKRFECTTCGCVFEAEKCEYEVGNQYNETYYACACPTCGEYTSKVIDVVMREIDN